MFNVTDCSNPRITILFLLVIITAGFSSQSATASGENPTSSSLTSTAPASNTTATSQNSTPPAPAGNITGSTVAASASWTAHGLCQNSPTGRVVQATPGTYQRLLSTLIPGDTLSLAPGNYPTLHISGLNGTASQCITITGPTSGKAAVIQGVSGSNTVSITGSSYIAIKNLTIDSLGIDSAFGIAASRGSAPTHHIIIESNVLVGQGASQQTDGISTKVPTWGWVIRKNKIIGAGTGMYLGNSGGRDPFVGGIIEYNLIQNPIGYCMEIKFQNTRPSISGMPKGASSTIIRNNVFIKNDQASPDGDRPNVLVGGFPDSGVGADDLYEVYGNFFYHNPREALFQGSGRITFHDNIMVDGQYAAAVFQNQDLPLKLAYVYNNTIYTFQTGVKFGSFASQGDAVVGNMIFAANPTSGSIGTQASNLVDSFANASRYLNAPSFTLGSMDFYPKAGQAQGTAISVSSFTNNTDYNLDFNGDLKGRFTFRGAYAGSGTNHGWILQADIKVLQ